MTIPLSARSENTKQVLGDDMRSSQEVDGTLLRSQSSEGRENTNPNLNTNTKSITHWSHLEPLSSNKVKGNDDLNINAADISHSKSTRQSDPRVDMMINEEEEKQLFQDAVLEWRQGNSVFMISNLVCERAVTAFQTSICSCSEMSNITKVVLAR
jgi:hypothetical protein